MLKALLFDLDGTLADTDPIHRVIWREVLQPYGYEVDEAFYQQHISGRLNENIVKDLLPQLYPDQEPQFSADKEARFREMAGHQLRPVTGLMPLLTWGQQQQLAMAVVTNAPRANAEFMLQTLALTDTFNPVILAGELPLGKPDPLPYREALRQLNLHPEEAVVFEDSTSGICSAVGAGITTIGIATTHAPDKLYAVGATLVVPDFTDERLRQFGLL
ncbi:HAD-IA family hydrolase [Pseudanabaena sp. FACHB-2040]|uniref:HAD family hydrolase n=1 Tax=Pseudanabaena sp. FACHB-2040 TaxID=2692859 RepID=UPI0016860220|nr:HAD-IA family hydrolase [Pseudanabaena sp. FACHB-2040]MBD2259921.1 HAD-IA family hydrolase [Pseudanabaena sp. FACHB-2040]